MIARIALTGVVGLLWAQPGLAEPAGAQVPDDGVAAHATTARPVLVAANFGREIKPEARFDPVADVAEGFALLRRGKRAQAVELFDKVIASADQHLAGDPRPRLCRTAHDQRVVGHEAAVPVDDSVCSAHFGKGFALVDMGRGDLAEAELRKASDMSPNDAHFANEYAELFKSRRDWQSSYDMFARAWRVVDKSPTGADAKVAARALRGMGYTRIEMGRFDEAEQLFRQSQQYDPESPVARAELGTIARRKAVGS